MIKRLLLLVFAFYGGAITAQESRMNDNAPILEVRAFLSSLRVTEVNSRNTYSNAQSVENLIYKIQPSVYFYSGVVKSYGEKPKNLFTDLSSLPNLNRSNMPKNNIEIVTIKVNGNNDLNATVDCSVFSSFKNLKYIYIVSDTETTSQNITRMIRNSDEKYSVFYKIDRGDNNQ